MDLILDFQGFKDNSNHFIVKELAVVSKDAQYFQHWIVKPPFSYWELNLKQQKSCSWNTKYHHGLTWHTGDITKHELHFRLTDILKDCCVFVKGKVKADYIQEQYPNCYVMELTDC